MNATPENLVNAQLVSSIQDVAWIDLSDSHKRLRQYLETNITNACVRKQSINPIMVKGAFGIGKTATLHYLFHYAWTVLHVPAFILNLADLIDEISRYLAERNLTRLPNKDVSRILGLMVDRQLESLKVSNYEDIPAGKVFFPFFDNGNLTDYLEGFHPATCMKAKDDEYKEELLPLWTQETIKQSITNDCRALILLDEFEAKYHELKSVIEFSGGGILRDFLDDVTMASSTNYYCIIGNGPSSGYEVAKENRSAEARRIFVKQINAPSTRSLCKSFLKEFTHGHINFYWWLSRARPGQIKKLKESLQIYEDMVNDSYINFIEDNIVLGDPIDDMGESNVTFLKTDIIQDQKVEFKDLFKKLLIDCEPQTSKMTSELLDSFLEKRVLFYCSKQLIDTNKILNSLTTDITKIKKSNSRYEAVSFDKIHIYLNMAIEAMSDENRRIAFGSPERSTIDADFTNSFLSPILGLVYDFVNIYEDETDDSIKTILDFLLDLANKAEDNNVIKYFRETLVLYEDNSFRLDIDSDFFVQLSLCSIRNVIEQPIGSPNIAYKSESTDELISDIYNYQNIFVHQNGKSKIIIIPDLLKDELLDSYLKSLEKHFTENWDSGLNYNSDGEIIVSVIYFRDCEKISNFKKWLLYKNGDSSDTEKDEELAFHLRRLNVMRFDDFSIHNSQRIATFLNAVCKIGVIGGTNNELHVLENENMEVSIKELISAIVNPNWTKSKHLKRTIEYYSDLLQNGENSAFSLVFEQTETNYKEQISSYIRNTEEISNYSYHIKLSDSTHFDKYSWGLASKNFISHILSEFEPSSSADRIKLLKALNELNLGSSEHDGDEISLRDVNESINKRLKNDLESISKSYLDSSSDLGAITRYIQLLISFLEINTVQDYLENLKTENVLLNSHFNYLGFSANKRYFLKGIFCRTIASQIESSSEQTTVISEINKHKDALAKKAYEIEESNEAFAKLFRIKEGLVNPEDIEKYSMKVITPYLTSSENDTSLINTVIGQIINQELSQVVESTDSFLEQMEEIQETISSTKEDIDALQEQIDTIYENGEDTPLVDLIKDHFKKPINKDYLYNTYILIPLKKHDERSTFNNVFDKTYKPNMKFYIERQYIQDLNVAIKEIQISKTPKVEEIVSELITLNNEYAESEQLAGYICAIMDKEWVQSKISYIDPEENEQDESENSDIEGKFNLAKQLVENGTEEIAEPVRHDQELAREWDSLIVERSKISTEAEFKKYKKHINKYFTKLYERITAPSVQKFTDWIQLNDNDPIIPQKEINAIRQTLIDNYGDYQRDLDTIALHIQELETSGTIFEGIKKEIRQLIVKDLKDHVLSGEELSDYLPDFIADFGDLLESMSNIDELHYTTSDQYFDPDEEIDDDQNQETIEQKTYYSGISKKIISANDKLIEDEIVPIDSVVSMITENIEDIKIAISDIKSTSLHKGSTDIQKILFQKFVQIVRLEPRRAQTSLARDMETVWNPMNRAYKSIVQFYDNYDQNEVEAVRMLQRDSGMKIFNRLIMDYTTDLKRAFSSNPLQAITSKSINEITQIFGLAENSIINIEEGKKSKDFSSYLLGIVKEYSKKKIPILKKLLINDSNVEKINGLLDQLKAFSETVSSEKTLLKALSSYYKYIAKKVDEIDGEYNLLLESSKAVEVIDFYNQLSEEGISINSSDLVAKIDKITKGIELGLVKVTIEKNV